METITLAKIIAVIEKIASEERNINTIIENDIYKLNALPDAKYCVFGITQNQHREDEDFLYYNFNLFYIDRLVNDDFSNEIPIQSTAIQVLRNIIRKTIDYLDIAVETDIYYETFEQKFSDMCAGAYAIVEFAVPLSLCIEE